jgi:hypothetical protein
MKRKAALAALATAITVALTPTAQAQAPAGDSVVGILDDPGIASFNGDARSDPFGGSPTGTAQFHGGGGLGPNWDVTITCLAVTGKSAIAGFIGTVSQYPYTSPSAGLFRVVDGGGPNSGKDSFEARYTSGGEGEPPIAGPTDCSSYPSTFRAQLGPGVNRQGNLVVTDNPQPLPPSPPLARIRVSLRVSDRTPIAGRRVRFYGQACPQHDGALVKIQHRTRKGKWRTKRRPRLRDIRGGRCSRYSTRLRVFHDSRYRAFVVSPDSDHTDGRSRSKRINVHRKH